MAYSFDDWQQGQTPPKGWDVADAVADGWSDANIDAFMRKIAREWLPKKTQERQQRAEKREARREMRAVAQEKPDEAEPPPQRDNVVDFQTGAKYEPDEAWRQGMIFADQGGVKDVATKNWFLMLENHPEMVGALQYDEFKMQAMMMRRPPWQNTVENWQPRPIRDADYSEAVMWLEAMRMSPKATNIQAVMHTVCSRHTFDRLSDYLNGLVWDGVPRIETALSVYFGVEDTEYARTVSKAWFISSVARGLKAGCKVDTMVILEGPQGLMKSSALNALYGDEFFTDELSDIGSKDAMMELQGIWGLEVAEMHRLNSAEANAVKKFLSRRRDRFRPPYGRNVIEAPRRVVLAGTINPEGNPYLKDPTGARRFFPIACTRIALDRIERDRDQIWAEAVALLNAGQQWWVTGDRLAAVEAEQAKRTDVDVWTSVIAHELKASVSTYVTEWDVFEWLKIVPKDADTRQSARVGRIMKQLGWNAGRDMGDGENRRIYKNPNALPISDDTEVW